MLMTGVPEVFSNFLLPKYEIKSVLLLLEALVHKEELKVVLSI